jgi:hypothetical protein
MTDGDWEFRCSGLLRQNKPLPEWSWTETDWLQCTDFRPIKVFLGLYFPNKDDATKVEISLRKQFLIAVACCREISHLFKDVRLTNAVLMAEQFAEGNITAKERKAAHRAVAAVTDDYYFKGYPLALWSAAWAAANCAYDPPLNGTPSWVAQAAASEVVLSLSHSIKVAHATWKTGWEEDIEGPVIQDMRARIANHFKDVLGNPFRPARMEEGWKTSELVEQAKTIYQSREFGDMPALANALEKVGCSDEEILAHCRQTCGHVRGCWVIDRLMDNA